MIATLEKSISREVVIPSLGYRMRARLEQPTPSRGIVVFANGFGSARFHPGNRIVADALESADFATLMVDLLAPQEEEDPQFIFDTSLPARRLGNVIRWLKRSQEYQDWPIGVFGSGNRHCGHFGNRCLHARIHRSRGCQGWAARSGRNMAAHGGGTHRTDCRFRGPPHPGGEPTGYRASGVFLSIGGGAGSLPPVPRTRCHGDRRLAGQGVV